MAISNVTSQIQARLSYKTGSTAAFDTSKDDIISCAREASGANALLSITCRASDALNFVIDTFPAPELTKDGGTGATILDPGGVPCLMSRFLFYIIEATPESGETGSGAALVRITDIGASADAFTIVSGDAEIRHRYAAIPLLSTSKIEIDFTDSANLSIRVTVLGFQGLNEVGGGYSY
jgi:hypothetical protein